VASFSLVQDLYLYPTPGGTYNAVSTRNKDKSKAFLNALLRQQETPKLTLDNLMNLTGLEHEEQCLKLLHHCQKLGWVQGMRSAVKYPEGALDEILPELLANISENNKVLLADNQGLYLASNGFPHEVAEELAALSAKLTVVHEQSTGLLMNNLGVSNSSWAIVDAKGCSKIGFWPMYIGETQFVLVISGAPRFNQPEFVSLVWALSTRYAGNKK
jgi:hypothetical protein